VLFVLPLEFSIFPVLILSCFLVDLLSHLTLSAFVLELGFSCSRSRSASQSIVCPAGPKSSFSSYSLRAQKRSRFRSSGVPLQISLHRRARTSPSVCRQDTALFLGPFKRLPPLSLSASACPRVLPPGSCTVFLCRFQFLFSCVGCRSVPPRESHPLCNFSFVLLAGVGQRRRLRFPPVCSLLLPGLIPADNLQFQQVSPLLGYFLSGSIFRILF
jgi:hypothetical protein